MTFWHGLSDWLSMSIDREWLEENISWRDFGTGVRLGKLKREEKTSLVLYEANVMMEYLDERFPHPPLLPVYPVVRAESRLYMYRIERDWCRLADLILTSSDDDEVAAAQHELSDSLIATAPIFAEKDFFMSEDFTLVDCCIAPILWRLPQLGIDLPEKQAAPMLKYMECLFEREGFKESLSETEREMRI